MRSLPVLVTAAAALSASLYLTACTKPSQNAPEAAPGQDPQTGTAPAGGMKAYIDPDTGKLTDKPPAGAEPIPGDVQTPPPNAVEEPAPGGGTKLDLRPKDEESDPAE